MKTMGLASFFSAAADAAALPVVAAEADVAAPLEGGAGAPMAEGQGRWCKGGKSLVISD